MHLPSRLACLPLSLLALALASCASGTSSRAFVGADFNVVDSLETTVAIDGLGEGTGDSEYDAIRASVGVVNTDGERPTSRFGLVAGPVEFNDAEALEVGLGGYWYVPTGSASLRPFVGAQILGTLYDEDDFGDIGEELSGVPTAGLEYALTEHLSVVGAAEYRIPLKAADGVDGTEVETDGFNVRLGVVFVF